MRFLILVDRSCRCLSMRMSCADLLHGVTAAYVTIYLTQKNISCQYVQIAPPCRAVRTLMMMDHDLDWDTLAIGIYQLSWPKMIYEWMIQNNSDAFARLSTVYSGLLSSSNLIGKPPQVYSLQYKRSWYTVLLLDSILTPRRRKPFIELKLYHYYGQNYKMQ